jgi:hypothetical protein
MRRCLGLLLTILAAGAGKSALAQEACKSIQVKNPPTLSEMYGMADKYAKAWKKDAIPARIGNTSLGPLQPNGSSAAWNLQFFSPSANASVAINAFRGTLTCWAQPGPAGRLPDLKPDFFRDGAKLYALAKQNGAAPLAQGYAVMIQTAAAPSDRHATWYITYSKEQAKDPGVTVIVDANTGSVEKVLKD